MAIQETNPSAQNMAAAPEMDLVDKLSGLEAGGTTHRLRHWREKVALATQGSYEGLFDPELPGLSLVERLLVAFYACRLSNADSLAAHYRSRLSEERSGLPVDEAALALVEAGRSGTPEHLTDRRLRAILTFTRTLILKPVEGDRAALEALPAAGISTPAVVTLAQLIAFMSYQIRLVSGLGALQAAKHK